MIAIQRIRTINAIHQKFRGDDKKKSDLQLLLDQRTFVADNTKPIKFNSAFWKTAKTQLIKESHGKCAYCEADTKVVAHGDVEHFRPKSKYWWLAYTYDNYLYACQICNQTYKSDNFVIASTAWAGPVLKSNTTDIKLEKLAGNISPDPVEIDQNYTLTQFLSKHNKEKSLLLNPYFDNPTTFFAYEADDTLEEVKIIPSKSKYTDFVKAAEEYYGINRIELCNARHTTYRIFKLFKHVLKNELKSSDPLVTEIQAQINKMLSDKYIFAGMNRYFDKVID